MPPVFDFYSPYVSAAIYDPVKDVRYPLWSNVDPAALEAANVAPELRALSFLQNIVVEQNLGPIPKITAELDIPYREGIAFLNSDLIEWGVSHLQVQFGYTGGTGEDTVLSPVYEGILLKPDVVISGERVGITYNAQGVGAYSAVRQKSSYSTKYDGGPQTRETIIRRILNGPDSNNPRNIELDLSRLELLKQEQPGIVSTIFEAIKNPQLASLEKFGASLAVSSYDSMFTQPIDYNQGAYTDWWAVWNLVRECRCTMTLLGNTLQIIPFNLQFATKPRRTLRMGSFPQGQFGPGTGVLPLLEFSTQAVHQYMPGALRGLALRGVDSAKREEVELLLRDEDVRTTRTGEGKAVPDVSPDYPDVDTETGRGGDVMPGSPVDKGVVELAQGEFDAFTQNMGLRGTATTLGDPLLFPADVVRLAGLGERIDANYAILKMTHRIGLSGYSMELDLVSNVGQAIRQAQASSAQLRPAGQTNTEEPDPDAPGSVDLPPPIPNEGAIA